MIEYNQIENFLAGKTTFGPMPSRVDIDLTNVCNQDCFYCNSAEFRQKFLVSGPTPFYYRLIDQLYAWKETNPNHTGGINEVVFTGGGEPTVHKDYHKIVEYCIDKNFKVQIITNGSKLQKLVDYLPQEKIKNINWIGVDIDSAVPETYEKIRKSLTKQTLFHPMKKAVISACKKGYVCDIKVLLMEQNTSEYEIEQLFRFVQETGANKLHMRPFCDYENKKVFEVTEQMQTMIQNLSVKYNVKYNLNLARSTPRTYTKCHQMFLYPIFASNGDALVCCEGRGQKQFSIGNWMKTDVRKLWYNDKHMQIYNNTDVSLCPPCTPNKWNNAIQTLLQKN